MASDPGWGRAQAARRMLVSLIVALATSYYVASRLGQPVLLAMAGGGVLGLISSFMVADAPIVQMGARVGWHAVPYAAGLGLGLFLAADGGGVLTIPPVWWLAAAVLAILAAVAVMASIPALIGARIPAAQILQSETA